MQGLVNQAGSNVKTFQAARTNSDLTLLPAVAEGDYVYSNEPVLIDNGQGDGSVTVDRSTAVNIIGSAFSPMAPNGRNVTRLSNGWLIAAENDTDTAIRFYVSKDSGATWSFLTYRGANCSYGLSITSIGTVVHCVSTANANSYFTTFRFDALIATTAEVTSFVQIDGPQTSFGIGCSIVADSAGVLHAAWSSKNATYPSSFNIRYSKSSNGGVSWDTPTQITYKNNGNNIITPSLSLDSAGKVHILAFYVYDLMDFTNARTTPKDLAETDGSWSSKTVYASGQNCANPCSVTSPDGTIHVIFEGLDTTDNSFFNIRYSKSTDAGVTWSTPVKLTTGNTYAQAWPCITADSLNNVYVVWAGKHAASATYFQIRKVVYSGGSWGAIVNITSAGTTQTTPHLVANHTEFTDPLCVWADGAGSVKFRGVWTETYSLFDRNAVSVVGSAYDTSGNGGRKLVRLSNGWLVAATANGTTEIRFYVSKDNGATWSRLFYSSYQMGVTTNFAVASYGNIFYCFYTNNNTTRIIVQDVTTATDINVSPSVQVESSSFTTMGAGCSITVDSNGILHAVWCLKNATYPNSFNIRYSKSTDGGATWAAPTQISTSNTAGYDEFSPCIAVLASGNPIIVWDVDGGPYWYLYARTFNGSSWNTAVQVRNNDVYQVWPPSVTVTSDDNIHIVFDGMDSTDTTYPNIRYTKSTDNGATFSAAVKLTSGNTVNQSAPSIASDASNNIHVVWNGDVPGGSVLYNIRRLVCTAGTWGSIIEVTPDGAANHRYFPQTCDNYKDFTTPLMIWQDNVSPSIKFSGTWREGSLTIDRTTPVSVVGVAYDTSGNGGRKLVRLSNGWLVACAFKTVASYEIYFYVSKDNGATWSQLSYIGGTVNLKVALASFGTMVYAFVASNADFYFTKFDALSAPAILSWGTDPESGVPNAVENVSITTDSNGNLHAAWSSKSPTYPDSYNIRYSKSTDGGVTWATPTQITANNGVGVDYHTRPCIIIRSDGNPTILFRQSYPSFLKIKAINFNGSAWGAEITVHDGGDYTQTVPCVVVDSSGVLHVAWCGYDAAEPTKLNIRYSKSTDGGATWSTAVKLTTGNTYDQQNPSVATDENNNVYVMFEGMHSGSPSDYQIRKIVYSGGSWGTVSNVTAVSATMQQFVSLCANYDSFSDPLAIWKDAAGSVKFRGFWTQGGGGAGQTIPAISAVTIVSQIIATAAGALKTLGETAKRYMGFVSKREVGVITSVAPGPIVTELTYDSSLTANTGSAGGDITNSGTVTSVAAKVSNGASLNATDSLGQSASAIGVSDNFSVSFWYKANDLTDLRGLFGLGESPSGRVNNGARGLWFGAYSTGFYAYVNSANDSVEASVNWSGSILPSTSAYKFVVVAREGDNLKMSVDNSAYISVAGMNARGAAFNAADPLRLYTDPKFAAGRRANGIMDQFRIYGKVLTAADIEYLYNGGAGR